MAGRLRTKLSTDVLIALAFGVAAEIETLLQAGGRPSLLAAAALAGPTVGLPLALRRSRPLLAMALFTLAGAAGTVQQSLLMPPGAASGSVLVPILALLLLSYSLGAYGTPREIAVGGIQPLLLIVVVDLLQPGGQSLAGALPFFGVFVVGAPVLAGHLTRARVVLARRLEDQQRQIAAERAAQTAAVLALERLQLADRLRETLVTGMESLLAQVGVARRSLGPRRAEAVAGIEASARALLGETREVVVTLASSNPRGVEARGGATVPGPPQPQRNNNAALPWVALAAAAVCLGLLIETRSRHSVPIALALAGCFGIAAPIALSWSRPLLMTAALWAAGALFSILVTPLAGIFTAICLVFLPPFAVAFFESRNRALLGLGICALGLTACFPPDALPGDAAFGLFAWVAGRVLRARSGVVEELRTNNAWLAEQREFGLRKAVLEERGRVARELHDATGHGLTVIALQAGAARRLWTSDPVRAEAALATIARVAEEALAELKLGFAANAQPSRSETTARLAGVEALLDGARGAGLAVNFRVDGAKLALPADTELAAFRVLQEALTNVLRHAPGATADVLLRNAGAHLELVVVNSSGDQQPPPPSGAGAHGLEGMQQRVEACGGRLHWGRRSDGGFEVRAEFPAELVKA